MSVCFVMQVPDEILGAVQPAVVFSWTGKVLVASVTGLVAPWSSDYCVDKIHIGQVFFQACTQTFAVFVFFSLRCILLL